VVDDRLLVRIDALDPTTLSTYAFRHVAVDRHPLSGAGARLHGGRWNPPGSFSTRYLALERETTINEFYRLATRQGRAPTDFLPRRMYRYEVALNAILDIRDAAARASLDLSDDELCATDALKCQEIGETAHYLGLEALSRPQPQVTALFSPCSSIAYTPARRYVSSIMNHGSRRRQPALRTITR
jgi:RES domain-containing protein